MYPPRFVVFLDMRTAIQRVEYSVSWYVLHYTRYQYSMFRQKFLYCAGIQSWYSAAHKKRTSST